MKETYITWTLGAAAVALSLACTVLNVVLAYTTVGVKLLAALRALLFVTFGVSLFATAALVFFTTSFVQKLHNRSISFNHRSAWRRYWICAGITAFSASVSAVTLIWFAVRHRQLPRHSLRQSSKILSIVWFVVWGLATVVQAALFVFAGQWTKKVLRAQSVRRSELHTGNQMPQMDEFRPTTRKSSRSFGSQDPTLHSPPRTPVNRPGSSMRRSLSIRGPNSSRTKLVRRGSARSSLDYPVSEAAPSETAFDRWDTSSVHPEIRMALHSSPSANPGGLPTIPGSRSVSPADALEGPFLPDSPVAISSDTPTAVDWQHSSPPKQYSSSPPSSPPNFSRPTSRSYNKPLMSGFVETSASEHIHPLFRPNSPHPPPIAAAGTMVTASPLLGNQ